MSTNLNLVQSLIQNGSIQCESSLNDYPRLTLVEYIPDLVTRSIGSNFIFNGLTFTLENFTADVCIQNNITSANQKQITYTYTHISKRLYEYPIVTKDFLTAYKNQYSIKTNSSYYFSIGLLVNYALGKVINAGTISPPAFLVEISNNPSVSDTITLKQLIDDKLNILGLVYKFNNDNLSFTSLGSSGRINSGIVSNVTLGVNSVPTYKNTLLTWSQKDNYDTGVNAKIYIQIKPSDYVTYEGDYNPHLAPPETMNNSIYPRDLSIMFDSSGETKSCKITSYKFSQPATEISATWGYAHSALELVADPTYANTETDAIISQITSDVINSGNAFQEVLTSIQANKLGYPDSAAFSNAMVWRLISIKATTYIYQSFNPQINPMLQNSDGTLTPVTIPSNYQQYLYSNMQVLVAEQTTGWELKRFATEDATKWTKGSISAWLNLNTIVNSKSVLTSGANSLTQQQYNWMLYSAKVNLEQYLYRKIPIFERVDYVVEPYSKYYTDTDNVDWTVQYIPANQVNQSETDTTPIPVLFPDPNWEPNLMITAKSRLKTSIGLSGNPNYSPFSRNYYGTNPIVITSGSEEYEFTKYGILPSKNTRPQLPLIYSEYSSISDILNNINAGLSDTGTYYNNVHTYMKVSDYGIESNSLPSISTSNINTSFPDQILDKDDQYTTLTSIRVAQDNSYKSRVTHTSFNLSDGRPPRATIVKPMYQESKTSINNSYLNSVTYITSTIQNSARQYIASVNISACENLQEALNGAKFKLIMDNINNGSTISCQLNFNKGISNITTNAYIQVPGITGNWIVKRSVISVQYSKGNSFLQPINIEAGNYITSLGISTNTVQLANVNSNTSSVKVLINPNLPSNFGTPITSIPTNFSRWLDLSPNQ